MAEKERQAQRWAYYSHSVKQTDEKEAGSRFRCVIFNEMRESAYMYENGEIAQNRACSVRGKGIVVVVRRDK